MKIKYAATISVPGYLPMDDDPPVFDTPQEAWQYLASERERTEFDTDSNYSDVVGVDGHNGEFACVLSPTYHALVRLAEEPEIEHTICGDTPGYSGDHDLGMAYSVILAPEVD